MKKRKLTGILIGDPCGSYQRRFLEGALKILFDNDIDAAVFSSFGKRTMSKENTAGEGRIYDIINYSRFDALIAVPDTFVLDNDECIALLDNIKDNFKKPAVCADYDYDSLVQISTTDTDGMQSLTDHFLDVHGCRDIIFVSGFIDHPHSQMRLKGFRNSLESHGLDPESYDIFEGDYWYSTGEKFYSWFRETGRKMPDAIICSNEPMALSIISAFEKDGYRIPEDLKVAGFDSDDDEIYNRNVLTSCSRDSYSTGQRSAIAVCRMLGTDIDETSADRDHTSLCIGKTCGCEIRKRYGKEYNSKGIDNDSHFYSLRSDFNFMLEDLVQRRDIEDFMWGMNWYITEINNFDRFTICLNDNIFTREPEHKKTSYSSRMIAAYDLDNSKENAEVNMKKTFSSADMYPFANEDRPVPSVFYFSPFHCYNRCFGYMITEYRNRAAVYHRDFRLWRRHINVSFESLRRYMEMKETLESNYRLNDEMRRTQEELILAFAEITESKSGQTGQHVKRVSEYSKVLAEAMGLSEEDTEILRTASMMHDIGKLTISADILEKPGKLTEDEFKIIKTHVTAGEKMLHKSPGRIMSAARLIALEHHEKWDGNGYLKKSGNDIDFFSRIVAVADVYDALVSRRSYKEPFSERRAFEIIVSEKGKHFDPMVIDAFVKSYDRILDVLKNHPDCH